MEKFNAEAFLTDILEELRSIEDSETDIKRRSMLANIIGRLGTFNWMTYESK